MGTVIVSGIGITGTDRTEIQVLNDKKSSDRNTKSYHNERYERRYFPSSRPRNRHEDDRGKRHRITTNVMQLDVAPNNNQDEEEYQENMQFDYGLGDANANEQEESKECND